MTLKPVPTAYDGFRHVQAGQLREAETSLKATLRANPKDMEALYYLGSIYLSGGLIEKGASHLRKAIRLGLETVDVFNNLGAACVELDRHEEAERAFKRALEMNPAASTARFNLARLLTRTDPQAAIAQYRHVVEHNPEYFEALINLSELYVRSEEDLESAKIFLDRALGIAPDRFEVHRTFSEIFFRSGMISSAAAAAEKAIAMGPNDPMSRWLHGIINLQLGRLEIAWAGYDKRFNTHRDSLYIPDLRMPRWEGQSLDRSTIIVWTDQGIGDDIVYGTFLPDLLAQAKQVTLLCWGRLVPIFERTYPNLSVRSREEDHASKKRLRADYQIPLTELGRFYRPTFDHFPTDPVLLQPDANLKQDLRSRYEALKPGQRLIGISWKSKRNFFDGGKVSELEDWLPILKTPGCTFVSLQYGVEAEEIEAFNHANGTSLHFDPTVDPLKDMDASFAQCAAMDLVISTSNTTVHTAASTGTPTWLVLPEGRGQLWYWFMVRSSSPFYPSMRIFRRGAGKLDVVPPWSDVLASVKSALDSERQGWPK